MNRSERKDKGNGQNLDINVADAKEQDKVTVEEETVEEETVTISRSEYEDLVGEAARLKEQYLLAVADFENFRKRMEKEREDIVCFANEKLISDLLPILDNLQRALTMELDKAGIGSVLEGVRMVSDQLHSVLSSCGLEPVEAVGGPFDPQHHEAVGVLPSEDHAEGTVVSELQRGYKLKGKVLRPSMVHVARQPEGSNGGEGDN